MKNNLCTVSVLERLNYVILTDAAFCNFCRREVYDSSFIMIHHLSENSSQKVFRKIINRKNKEKNREKKTEIF